MKRILVTCLSLMLWPAAFAQKARRQFEYADQLFEDKHYDSALIMYARIYNRGTGSPSLVSRAYFNMGIAYLQKRDTASASGIFRGVLTSDFNEMDAGGRGEGLMADPYALYKNNSCNILADLALNQQDYKAALKYVEMADKQYPYLHFCGNAYASNDIYMATMYAKCYEGLRDKERAIQVLLPHCIENGLASNRELVDQLCKLLKEQYSKAEIKQQVESALSGIYRKEIKHTDNTEYGYYIKIFNAELRLHDYSFNIDYKNVPTKEWMEICKNYFTDQVFVKTLLNN